MPLQQTAAAIFDFDNTLVNRDSLLPFLFYLKGFWKTLYHLTALIPTFASYLIGKLSRQEMKEAILSRFLGGMSFAEVQALGDKYAKESLDRFLKPEAMKRLSWHQAQGHRCILVSASLDFYLKPWSKRHGFEEVIASRLALTPSGHITGRLAGLNCWGEEKRRRLLEYLGPNIPRLFVYGDSSGDREILEMADYSFYRTFG